MRTSRIFLSQKYTYRTNRTSTIRTIKRLGLRTESISGKKADNKARIEDGYTLHKKKGHRSAHRINLHLRMHEWSYALLIDLVKDKTNNRPTTSANYVPVLDTRAGAVSGLHALMIPPLTMFIHISICEFAGFAGTGASFSSCT